MITQKQFWNVANVKQHSEFESFLKKIVFDKSKRTKFFKQLLAIDAQIVQEDTFKRYFEDYSAERKANKQDYTPDEIALLLSKLSNQKRVDTYNPLTETPSINSTQYNACDFTAGTGSLLIQKWWFDMTQETPWNYKPHNYFYFAQEYADNAIPYLLLNLALRGMNCVVIHGDTLTNEVKQIYLVENPDDNYLGFSDINVMPHNDDIKNEFGVSEWVEEEIDHIETPEDLVFDMSPSLPLKFKGQENELIKSDNSNPIDYVPEQKGELQVKDIAEIERAKAKKVYPAGAIVVQISATRGQCGRLKSSGEVDSQYAVIQFKPFVPSFLMWQQIKINIPKWLVKYKEGLNVKLEDVGKIPVFLPVNWMIPFEEQGKDEQLSLL